MTNVTSIIKIRKEKALCLCVLHKQSAYIDAVAS